MPTSTSAGTPDVTRQGLTPDEPTPPNANTPQPSVPPPPTTPRNTPQIVQQQQQQQQPASLLDPVQVFENWKRQHSADVLRNESIEALQQRKYITGFFSCPHQAGVQAGVYTNHLLLAIATNRTFLFQYNGLRGWIANGGNAPEVCYRIFQQADWMPLYSDYAKKLSPKRSMAPPGNSHVIRDYINQGKQEEFEDLSQEQVVQPVRLWNLGIMTGYWQGIMNLTDPYASEFMSRVFGLEPFMQQDARIHKLYAEGAAFLYGMLFFESFPFQTDFLQMMNLPQPTSSTTEAEDEVFGIAMHSRHTSKNETGANVENEIKCLDKLVTPSNLKNRTCHLYIMSDREATLQKVSLYASSVKHCQVFTTADRQTTEETDIGEHGPFAGTGYFQDLALVSQAQSAVVMRSRSSSMLVVELMEYRRRIAAWKKNGTRGLPSVLRC